MEEREQIVQLETLFFSTLDALRGVWEASNASNVLLSLVFYKRILALKEEEQIDFLITAQEDYHWSTAYKNNIVKDPEQATRQLCSTLATFAQRNESLKNIFVPLIFALEQEKNTQLLIQVILTLEELDFSTLAISISSFGAFFNDSLSRTALRAAGKQGVKRTTPKNINQLLASLANPQDGDLIYDPTAGQGSTLVAFLDKLPNIDFLTQEQNIHTWALCKMNLLLNGAYHAQIAYGNSLTDDAFCKPKVDIAVAHFPFGQYIATEKIKQQSYTTIPFDVNTPQIGSNSLFIQLMLSKLNKEGKLLAILPIQSLMQDKEDRKLREFLIRRDLLEAVISLPYGLLYTTGIPVSILVINKKKTLARKEHILFINGANLEVKTQSKLHRKLTEKHIECIAAAFHHLDSNCSPELESCIALVGLDQVISNDYNLDTKQYASPFIAQLKQLEEKGWLIQLKTIFKTDKPILWFDEIPHQNIPYVCPHDLVSSITNYILNTQNITSTNEAQQVVGQLVNESVLLINRSGNKLLASYFVYNQQPILVNEDIMTFRIDENKVLLEYLLLQLHDNLFLQQLNMYKTDYQYKTIDEQRFEELQINLPPMEEQTQIVKETKIRLLREEEQKVEQLRHDLNLGKQRAQSEQYKIISSLQHELGNRLPAVLTEFKNLKYYLKEKENNQSPIAFSEPISPIFEEEEMDEVDRLETIMERIESMLVHSINSLDSTSDIIKADRSKMRLEQTKIKEFLEETLLIYANDPQFKFQIEVAEDEQGKELEVFAKIDKAQFSTIITNLVDNARRHGFIRSYKKYTIQFRVGLSSDQQEAIIIYKNDGEPFPSNFSFEDFISYGNYAGNTGHSGIGGYLIHQIIDNHNGNISYRKDISYRDPFKVQFEITLPAY